jgi:hypothetical protein
MANGDRLAANPPERTPDSPVLDANHGSHSSKRITVSEQNAALGAMRTNGNVTDYGFGDFQIVGPHNNHRIAESPMPASRSAQKVTREGETVRAKQLPVDPQPYLFAAVNSSDVEEGRTKFVRNDRGLLGYQPGILQFGDSKDLEKFQTWLNAKIPNDGTTAADDRRTALIVKIAMTNATMVSDQPSEQAANAYQTLNAMRHVMSEQLPDKGYSLDPGIANAEHFLETAHRVGGTPFDGNADDLSGELLRGKWSAPIWEGISAGYNGLKQIGVISGSKADNQHKWESNGIEYGRSVYDASQH